MIDDGVLPNKYEIPGSLAGLDWKEKCIISPWTHCGWGSYRYHRVSSTSERQTYLETQRERQLEAWVIRDRSLKRLIQ